MIYNTLSATTSTGYASCTSKNSSSSHTLSNYLGSLEKNYGSLDNTIKNTYSLLEKPIQNDYLKNAQMKNNSIINENKNDYVFMKNKQGDGVGVYAKAHGTMPVFNTAPYLYM
jgi:ribosome biogenesis protein Nip4